MPFASHIRSNRHKPDVRPFIAGANLHDIVMEFNPETGDWQAPTVCFLNDAPILRKDWKETTLAETDAVSFVGLPMGGGGGGSNPLQVLFSVILIAVSIVVPPMLATTLLGQGLLAAAIMTVGGLLMGALFKAPALPSSSGLRGEEPDSTYSVGGGNRARLWEVIPEGFGRMRIVPDQVAKPWAYYMGNRMFYYVVMGLGRGLYNIESMAFGDTIFWRKEGWIFNGRLTVRGLEDFRPTSDWSRSFRVAEGNEILAENIVVTFNMFASAQMLWLAMPTLTATGYVQYRPLDSNNNPTGSWQTKQVTMSVKPSARVYFPFIIDGRPAVVYVGSTSASVGLDVPRGRYEIRVSTVEGPNIPIIGGTIDKLTATAQYDAYYFGAGMVAGYDVEYQFLEPGQAVTLFPDNVETSIEVSGQEVFPPNSPEYTGILGPYSANPPGTVTTRIVNNITFPRGGGRYNDEGNLEGISFRLIIQAQKIDDNNQELGGWFNLFNEAITYKTVTPQRLSIDRNVPEGRYQVRVYRTDTPSLDGRTMSQIIWESLFSFLPGTLSYNQSVIAMRVEASNVITQQAVSSLAVTCTRKLPLYNPKTKTWSAPQPTRKLAAALSAVLKQEWGGNLPDRLIDLDALWGDIDAIMERKGWTFDGSFSSFYRVWDLVLEICQPFRLAPRLAGGTVTFIYDQPGRPVRHIFTERSIIRNTLSITYNTFSEKTPDDLMWGYLDEGAGFQRREVRCAPLDSKNQNPAIKEVIGVVKREQAHKMGVFQAACNRKRRIVAKFQTEAQGRLILMGDVCTVNHPFYSALASGALAWWNEDALSFDLGVELSEPQEDIYLALTQPDGRPWGPCKIAAVVGQEVFLDREDYELLLSQGFSNPFDWVDFGQGRAATVWTIQSGKEYSGRMLVQSVTPLDPWRWEITAINDDPTVDEFEDMPVPPWEWRAQTSDTFRPMEAPRELTAEGLGTPEAPIVRLAWLPVAGAAGYRVEQGIGAAVWGQTQEITTNSIQIEVSPGSASFRVAARDSSGRIGGWSRWSGETDSLFFPAPIILEAVFESGEARLSWSAPPSAVGMGAPAAWVVTLLSPDGFSVVREVELPPGITDLTYTAEMMAADGGPWELLNVELRFRTYRGQLSEAAALTLIDPYWPQDPEEPEV